MHLIVVFKLSLAVIGINLFCLFYLNVVYATLLVRELNMKTNYPESLQYEIFKNERIVALA